MARIVSRETMAEAEKPVSGARKRNRRVPNEARDLGVLGAGQQGGVRSEPGQDGGEVAVADGTGDGPIEALVDLFGAARQHANRRMSAARLFEENCLPLMCFDQGDLAIGTGNRDRKTGEAGARTDVADPPRPRG